MPGNSQPSFKIQFKHASARCVGAVNSLSRLAEVATDTSRKADPARTAAARELFAAFECLMECYRDPKNWRDGQPQEVIPAELARVLGGLCGYLAVGKIPDPIKDVAGPGEKKPGPTERHDIEIALAYIAAAKAGEVRDGSPVKTIIEEYQVKRRTVEIWSHKFSKFEVEPTKLFDLMKQAGRRYRAAGRSETAVATRDKKRHGGEKIVIAAPQNQIVYEEEKVELSRMERVEDIKRAIGD
jgi:anti-sigma28 factor (negative regulator of flagellin synthesis)